MENLYSSTDSECKLILFYGGDSQVGTTMLSQSLAELAGKQGEKILYVPASKDTTTDYFKDFFPGYLDEIAWLWKDNDKNKLLDEQKVEREYFDSLPTVGSLAGWKRLEQNFLAEVFQTSKFKYDLMIVDGGSGPIENPIKGLFNLADKIVLVLSQNEKALRRFKVLMPQIMDSCRGNEGNIFYVVNKFNYSPAFYTLKELKAEIGCLEEKMVQVDFVPYGWQAEKEGKTLMWNKKFTGGVKKIYEGI